jgi:hypothetical protein
MFSLYDAIPIHGINLNRIQTKKEREPLPDWVEI